jgi:hypothetical protein
MSSVPSICQTCVHAEWKKTSNGRRHPDGTGRCAFQFPDSPLPKWLVQWNYGRDKEQIESLRALVNQGWSSRYIYWLDHHRAVPQPCATHAPKDAN